MEQNTLLKSSLTQHKEQSVMMEETPFPPGSTTSNTPQSSSSFYK